MHDMDWSEQVQVRRLRPDQVVWDGIDLAEAVRRVMNLPPNQRGEPLSDSHSMVTGKAA
jgi:hypothetical protein